MQKSAECLVKILLLNRLLLLIVPTVDFDNYLEQRRIQNHVQNAEMQLDMSRKILSEGTIQSSKIIITSLRKTQSHLTTNKQCNRKKPTMSRFPKNTFNYEIESEHLQESTNHWLR